MDTESITDAERTLDDRAVESYSASRNNTGPPPGLWGAIRANLPLVIASIVICTAAGLAIGVIRKPKYSATARLTVQHINLGAAGAASGFSTLAVALADTYSRSIKADDIVTPLALKFHLKRGTVRNDLSSAAIPESPMFTVSAQANSAKVAVGLVNAAMNQLVIFEQAVNGSNANVGPLYGQLVKAEGQLTAAQVARQSLQQITGASTQAAHRAAPTAAQQAQLAKADQAVNISTDRVNTLRAAYTQSYLGTSETQFLQPIQSAFAATSDRESRLALYGFAGLAIGILVGVGLAALRGPRRPRFAPVG